MYLPLNLFDESVWTVDLIDIDFTVFHIIVSHSDIINRTAFIRSKLYVLKVAVD